MEKIYQNTNVWEATQERIQYVFDEFESVLIAFSGGKDSGVCLNLFVDYAQTHGCLNRLAVYHLDYEAQYQATTDYVTETFDSLPDPVEKYWLCLPVSAQCAVNMEQDHWTPWEKSKKDIWVRDLPDRPYVITEDNVPFDFVPETWDYDTQDNFSRWFADQHGKTAVIIGIRTDESLSRLGTITSKNRKYIHDGKRWIVDKCNYSAVYPIYDWTVKDIWIANARQGWKYNKLYDLYYKAGLSIDQMRVASPFNDCAVQSLSIYKVIEPNTWAKLVGRVNGVNFGAIYGKTTAMGWKSIKLPEGHTWKSYLEFLLSTLPKQTRERYQEKFATSIKFWRDRGGCLSEETIQELKDLGIPLKVGSKTNYKTDKLPVTFEEYPDDADVKDFKSVPTYKRMCICIMKNDHLCKYMGFSQTKAESEKRKKMMEKYKNVMHGVIK